MSSDGVPFREMCKFIFHVWIEGCVSVELHREGTPPVRMQLDISEQNVTTAYLEIFLGVAVIVELFIFVALLQRNTAQILIAPLERIFNTIKKNAHTIVNALETNNDNQVPFTEMLSDAEWLYRPENPQRSIRSRRPSAR